MFEKERKIDTPILLKNVEDGFKTLSVSEKYKKAALSFIEEWLTKPMYKEYVPQIICLISAQKWNILLDSFYQIISFGTGGRRGPVGIGPNRINTWTIQASAQGHCQYLIKQYGNDAKKRGIVLTYDVRVYNEKGIYDDSKPNPVMGLNCRKLAESAASVYAANGIQVFFFEDVRSTPELSFAIRHLNAVAGDMFSASHNPPSDNGKKVFDEFGGQLIPPHDQNLVDEVTNNVKEIKCINFKDATKKGLVKIVGKEVDDAYIAAVKANSLSDSRDIKIIYTPLHGTGLTSVYKVLQSLNFKVTLDPKTSNMSGAFENVTFNIPNPEVQQSFDTVLEFANMQSKKDQPDIILSSDPDADRLGIMCRHKNEWTFFNGNEIGIILSEYIITKFKEKKKRGQIKNNMNECTIIKTLVTSSLIAKIAQQNSVNCIGDLLVGFKYIGEEMNKLEKGDKISGFMIGVEESHGYAAGNYIREKDASLAAMWLAELASELKQENKTLADYLEETYAKYGYCHNYLNEIRLLGATGMDQIATIMDHLRKTNISAFGSFKIKEKKDYLKGSKHLSLTDTVARNILIFTIQDKTETAGIKVTVRPSGTEPKVKFYLEIISKPYLAKDSSVAKEKIATIREELEKAVMMYCYKIISITFPERGFLLFWQLPLTDKMKYFEIEDSLAALKNIKDKKERIQKLNTMLIFLGSNPIEKVDKTFFAKFKCGIKEYLNI